MHKLLEKILTTRRCHNSQGEIAFASWLHGKLKTLGYEPVAMAEGCIVVKGGESRTMFSCHIDTMHSKTESDLHPLQSLAYDEMLDHVFLADKTATCLGADDGAGIFIMLQMLEAKVPGTYVFHRGEERGCIGSRAMLAKHRDWLDQFDACIAFDRPGDTEVIITQGGLPCASHNYGAALAIALNTQNADFKYETSTRGVLTDSKIYAYAIPECINIGVGYNEQHGPGEYQNVGHLMALADAAIKLDWAKLPITRVPPEEPKPYVYKPAVDARGHYGGPPTPFRGVRDFPERSLFTDPSPKPKKKKVAAVQPVKSVEPDLKLVAEICAMGYDELVDYLGDSELAKAFVHIRCKQVAAEAKADFLVTVMGLDV